MQLICLVNYAWIVSLKDKRGISIDNAFKKIISKDLNQMKYGLIKVLSLRIIFLNGF